MNYAQAYCLAEFPDSMDGDCCRLPLGHEGVHRCTHGLYWDNDPRKKMYLAGPMRGIKRYNLDAFIDAEEDLKSTYNIISPARHDLDLGLDVDRSLEEQGWDMNAIMTWDIQQVIDCDGVIVLPGWERSSGVAMELSIARTLGKPILLYPTMTELVNEPVAGEAQRIVYGARQAAYGPPSQDFERTGQIWGAILGTGPIPAHLVGLCMIAVKVSREVNGHKRDNLVDICGYALTLDILNDHE